MPEINTPERDNNKKIYSDLTTYMIGSKIFLKDEKEDIKKQIDDTDDYLFGNDNGHGEAIFNIFSKKYSDNNNIDTPIILTILQEHAGGLSATKNYKEIYFNEIIQNANDLSGAEDITIELSKDNNNYIMSFEYNDKGFSLENIISFFQTELQTKKKNLSSTGKYGVGIKSLFYFINKMTIDSNVYIEFNIQYGKEENSDKHGIVNSNSKLSYNKKRTKKNKTILTISFNPHENCSEYNIEKFTNFIDTCLDKEEIEYDDIQNYFFSDEQKNLIFDARNLLFTDKNKGKENGIKKLSFKTKDYDLFSISSCNDSSVKYPEENNSYIKNNSYIISKEHLEFNGKRIDNDDYTYIIFKKESSEAKKQNFSVAFPLNLSSGKTRFYETYYIPDEDYNFNISILINSEYSNTSRTRLTDGNNVDKNKIINNIVKNINALYTIMCKEQIGKSKLGKDISIIFHSLLNIFYKAKDINKNIDIFNADDINNRYLPKFKDNIKDNFKKSMEPYIIFKRNEEKEEYEKIYIGEDSTVKEKLKDFYEDIIKCEDSNEYNPNNLLEGEAFKQVYEYTFNKYSDDVNKLNKLKQILNVAGNIRDLFYYRIYDKFPEESNCKVDGETIDNWHNKLYNEYSFDYVTSSFKMLGRYKLNENINSTGDIKGASFYEYLFNDDNKERDSVNLPYPTFGAKQDDMFGKDYHELKQKLLSLKLNEKEIDVKKTNEYFYFLEKDIMNKSSCNNTDDFNADLSRLFINKIIDTTQDTQQMFKAIKQKFCKDSCRDSPYTSISPYPLICCHAKYEKGYNKTLTACQEDLGPDGVEYYNKLTRYSYDKFDLIDISFLNNIIAHSWEDFNLYFELLKKFKDEKKIYLNLNTEFDKSFDINALDKIYKFFNDNENYDDYKKCNNISFKAKFEGEFKNNLCDDYLFDFIKETTSKKIYITQSGIEKSKKKIMYLTNGNIFFKENYTNFKYTIDNNCKDSIYIVCGNGIEYKDAIIKVLNDIFRNNNNLVNLCEAFISSGKSNSYNSYNNFKNRRIKNNLLPQVIGTPMSNKGLNINSIKQLILARGNNNDRCSCCGKKISIDEKESNLAIMKNQNDDTKDLYKYIYTVTCKECKTLLENSLNNASICIDNDGKKILKINCKIDNIFQTKNVEIISDLYDGTLFSEENVTGEE